MIGGGVFIKVTGIGDILVCVRREGKERHYIYPLADSLHFRESFFEMEEVK